jgi:hypothetical protein
LIATKIDVTQLNATAIGENTNPPTVAVTSIYSKPEFHNNIKLNTYGVNTSLPSEGQLGEIKSVNGLLNSTVHALTTTIINLSPSITLTKGVWIIFGEASFNYFSRAQSGITDLYIRSGTSLPLYSLRMFGVAGLGAGILTYNISGVLQVSTSSTEYHLACKCSLSSHVTVANSSVKITAARIA